MVKTVGFSLLVMAACSNAIDGDSRGFDELPGDEVHDTQSGTSPNPTEDSEPAPTINEVAAKGDPEDWFEVINLNDEPVFLGTFRYADSGQTAKFADGLVLEPGQLFVQEVSSELAGFKLGKDEELSLVDGRGNVVDAVDWAEGDSPGGGSFARFEDGFRTVEIATRGSANE